MSKLEALMHELNTLDKQESELSKKTEIVRAEILLQLEKAEMKKFTADGIGTVTRESRETVKGNVKSIADEYPDLVFTPEPKLKVIAIRKVKTILEEMDTEDRAHAEDLLKIDKTNFIKFTKSKSNRTRKTTPDPAPATIKPATPKKVTKPKKQSTKPKTRLSIAQENDDFW